MSETCPFCQKTFKRLKTHLPRCKSTPVAMAANTSKNPPVTAQQPDVTSSKKTLSLSSSLPTSSPSEETTKKSKKSSTKRIEKPSPSSLSASQPSSTTSTTAKRSENTASLFSTTPSSSSPSLIPTTKKKKVKLADEMKSAAKSSSPSPLPLLPTSSPSPSPSLPTSHTITKPRKQSLRSLIQASQLTPISERQKTTEAPSLTLQSSPRLEPAAGPLSSRPLFAMDDLRSPVMSSLESDAKVTRTKVNHKPKHATAKRESHREEAKPPPNPQTTEPSISQDPLHKRLKDQKLYALGGEGVHADNRTSFWKELEMESNRDVLSKTVKWPGIGEAKPTVQVSTSSDSYNTDRHYSKKSTLAHIQTATTGQSTEPLYPKTHTTWPLDVDHGQTATDPPIHNSVTASLLATVANPFLTNSNSLEANMLLLNRTDNKTTKPRLRSTFTSPTPRDVPSCPPAAEPSTQAVCPPSAPSSTQGVGVGTSRVEGRSMHPQTTIHSSRGAEQEVREARAAVSEMTLGEVRLRALPGWLADRCPSNRQEGAEILQKGWQWYYRRYIDVKRGGVGGLAMLLAGYCVLSYMWSYPHIKRDRWRRYH